MLFPTLNSHLSVTTRITVCTVAKVPDIYAYIPSLKTASQGSSANMLGETCPESYAKFTPFKQKKGLDPYTISSLPNVGRVLVATNDIQPWELVLEDEALVLAPADVPVCLGCLGQIAEGVICLKCKWPICAQECQSSLPHQDECKILGEGKVYPSDSLNDTKGFYSLIAVLRVLLVKKKDVKKWEIIKMMMDHWEERSQNIDNVNCVLAMTKMLQDNLHLDWITLEDVQHVYGVLKTNSVSLKAGKAQALFPKVSLLSHSCSSNLTLATDPTDKIVFRAKRTITKGEELTIRYTDFLNSKNNIQKKLKQDWLFECCCTRCSDTSEFGTNFSSFICSCGGSFIKSNENSKGVCEMCSKEKDLTESYSKADHLFERLDEEDVDALSDLIDEENYHDHFYVTIKYFIRYIEKHEGTEDKDVLELLMKRLKSVIEILSILDQGCTRLNGKYLMMLMNTQQKILLHMKGKENANYDVNLLNLQILKGKLRAGKLLSSFFMRRKSSEEIKKDLQT